ncbi:MAG: acetyl-CoA hydrolase/transferase family protein [Hyphomicrobiaceae bacterium]
MTEELDLAGLMRIGDRIAWSGVALEPLRLLEIFESQLDRVPSKVSALLNISITEGINAEALTRALKVVAIGGAVTNRRFRDAGGFDVLPVNYSMLPELVRSRVLKLDCIFLQVAASQDALNLSLAVDHLADAVGQARVVVAEVNDQLPVTYGDTELVAHDVDHVVHVSRPPLEIASRPARDLEREVGRHVSRLVRDGNTLEVGLGSLPDAVLECLQDKHELGIHSGTIGDRVVELVEAGIITNTKKPIDTGKCITATLLGTQKLYRWAHKNDRLELRSPRYTHDVAVHAQIPNLVGVNSALEVDLTGQFNSETLDGRHVGVIGGQSDFMRGAIRSVGGRNIIVMESIARSCTISRISAKPSDGVVTATRANADYVVTEYGIAELRGRTLEERATALIAIAHPDFRRQLHDALDKGLV